mmetsp:Transcript_17424/g.35420  ORF Transcript_17424/g.35420 Transcript_17424/m.35420 type:complete len:125 (-) Transcript_17424:220-594(-)|eukprot:CAMPEP_0119068530 /NCGR_PEP_ID=MMETSP1178-20130426/10982_1 /TAXON_ID=33656 /ORGANISM="unid sp, Strain CCMP2000" /LENGTH=124 /DNA_ID=CAMNT_0007050245 /DNA_START=65 /DNA_END=439 /DNA_ORIENTATION=+
MAFLLSLSIDAYVLGGAPGTSPMRTTTPAMNGEAAKAAWFRKHQLSLGTRSRLAIDETRDDDTEVGRFGVVNNPLNLHGPQGAVHSTAELMQRIRSQAHKAKKVYVGKELELCTDRKSKGWTTN